MMDRWECINNEWMHTVCVYVPPRSKTLKLYKLVSPLRSDLIRSVRLCHFFLFIFFSFLFILQLVLFRWATRLHWKLVNQWANNNMRGMLDNRPSTQHNTNRSKSTSCVRLKLPIRIATDNVNRTEVLHYHFAWILWKVSQTAEWYVLHGNYTL